VKKELTAVLYIYRFKKLYVEFKELLFSSGYSEESRNSNATLKTAEAFLKVSCAVYISIN
jgi:hypothetical protein